MRRLQPRQLTAVGLSVLTALFLVAPSSSYLLSSSGRVPKKASGQTGDMTQTLFCPLWRVDGKFTATIKIKNAHLLITTTVIPTLYMADGTEYELPLVVMSPGDIKSISVNDALAVAPRAVREHLSEHGSAALRFSGQGMIVADLRSLNVPESLSYNSLFSMLQGDGSTQNVLEGLWWKHDAGVRPFISVANATEKTQQASLTIVGSRGSVLPTKEIILAGYESRFLRLDELIEKLPGEEAMEGGIRIQYTGESTDIAVAAGLENREEGFSAPMPFFLRGHHMGSPTKVSFASTGVSIGAPDAALGFPAATQFAPYLVERNTTDKPISVEAAVYYAEGAESKSLSLPRATLEPNHSTQVPLDTLLPALGLRGFNGAITLMVSYQGQPGDVQLTSGSVDETGTYVFGVNPQMVDKRTWGRDVPFWSVADGNDTMLSLWNPADQPEDVMASFSWNGGSQAYHLPIHLGAMASKQVGLAELIASQKPDSAGTLIPTNATEGSISITSLDPLTNYIHIVASAGVFNVKTATCVEPCICCPTGISAVDIVPSPDSTFVAHSTQLQVTIHWKNGGTSDGTKAGSYSSQNTSIATVQTSGGSSPGLVSGVGVGSTDVFAEFDGSDGARTCYPHIFCPNDFVSGSAPVPVSAPRITNIQPADFVVGTMGPITISGSGFSGFGSASIVFDGTGISAGAPTVVSDSEIQASYSVGCSALPQNVKVNFATADGGTLPTNSLPVGTAAPPAPAPTIMFQGKNIVGSNPNPMAVVGQQIVLTASVSLPACMSLGSQSWSQPTGTAVGGYTNAAGNGPPDTTGGKVQPIQASTSNSDTFYWILPQQGLQVAYLYQQVDTANGLSNTGGAVLNFNVTGPGQAGPMTTLPTNGQLHIDMLTDCSTNLVGPNLVFGDISGPNCTTKVFSGLAGIQFAPPTTSSPPGNFFFVQLVTGDSVVYSRTGATLTCTATNTPGFDGNIYPYQGKMGQTVNDAPFSPLPSTFTSSSRTFDATMYLMWQSTLTSSIPVSIGAVPWSFSGSTSQSNGLWGTPSGSGSAQSFNPASGTGGFPTWNGVVGQANNNCH